MIKMENDYKAIEWINMMSVIRQTNGTYLFNTFYLITAFDF